MRAPSALHLIQPIKYSRHILAQFIKTRIRRSYFSGNSIKVDQNGVHYGKGVTYKIEHTLLVQKHPHSLFYFLSLGSLTLNLTSVKLTCTLRGVER